MSLSVNDMIRDFLDQELEARLAPLRAALEKAQGPKEVSICEAEAARRLGVSVFALRTQRVNGTGPMFERLGTRILYRPDDLDAWSKSRRVRSTTQADALSRASGL